MEKDFCIYGKPKTFGPLVVFDVDSQCAASRHTIPLIQLCVACVHPVI